MPFVTSDRTCRVLVTDKPVDVIEAKNILSFEDPADIPIGDEVSLSINNIRFPTLADLQVADKVPHEFQVYPVPTRAPL